MRGVSTKTPRAPAETGDSLQNARAEALDDIFRYATVISGATALVNMVTSAGDAVRAPALWLSAGLCAAFAALWTSGQRPFRLRAGLLTGLLYAAAVAAFAIFGLGGAGTAYLIAATVIAAIFLGFRPGAVVTALAVVTGLGFTYLYLATSFQPLIGAALLNTWSTWAAIGGNLVLVFAVLVVPQRPLWESQSFVVEVSKQRQELLDARATLEKQTRQLETTTTELGTVNQRLQEQSHTLERRAQQLAAAAEIGRAATSTFDLPTLLEASIRLIHDRFGFYHASVFIIEPGSDVAELRESTGEAGRQLKARKHKLAVGSKSLVGTATLSRQAVVVQDVTTDPNYFPNPLLPATRAEAVLPLLRGEAVIGALDVQSNEPNAFLESDLTILSAMADQLAVAVQNARLYSETQGALARNEALFKISAALAEASTLQEILDVVAKNAMPRGTTRAALVMMRNDAAGKPVDLEVRAYVDAEGKFQRTGLRLPVASTPLIAQLGFAPLTISDIYSDPQVDPVTRETLARLDMVATCFVPLRVGGQLTGAILASSEAPTEFNPDEVALLRSITDQIVVTMEKLRLLEDTRRRAEQLTAAADVGRAATSTLDLPALLAATVNLIRDRFGFYHASVFIVEPGTNVAEIRESTGDAGRRLKERKHKLAIGSRSLVGTATATRQPVVVQDVRSDPNYYPNPLLPDTRAEAVLPMLSGETVIGAVDVQSTMPNAFVESEVAILATLVGQLAVAVQNARLYDETQTRVHELGTLNQISRAISSTINIDEVFAAVRDQLVGALGVDNLYLGLYDAQRDLISFPFMLERGQLIPFEPRAPTGRTRYLVRSRKPLRLEGDAAQVAEHLQRLGISPSSVAKSYLGVPLALGDRLMGVLVAQDYDRINAFNANHERILTTVADQLAVAIQNARLYAQTQDRLGELTTLNRLSRAFTSSIDTEQIYQAVRVQVAEVMNVTDIYLALYDEEHSLVSFPFMIDDGQPVQMEPRAPSGLTGHILRTRQPLLLEGSAEEVERQTQALGALTTAGGAALSYFGVPLMAGQRVIGVLAVQHLTRTDAFDADHQRILTTIADQLAVTLQNARLYAETQSRLGELASLNQLSRAFASTLNLDEVYRIVRERLALLMGVSDLYLALYDEAEDRLSYAFLIERGLARRVAPQAPAGLNAFILHSKEPLSVQGTEAEVRQRLEALGSLTPEGSFQPSFFGTPLMVGQQVIGVLGVQDAQRLNAFDADHQRLMTTIGSQLAVTIQNARLFAQTQAALAENATLFKVSRALSEVASVQGILQVVAAEAMPRGTTRADLLWLHYDEKGLPAEIEIRAHVDITGETDERLGQRFPAQAAPLISRLPTEPLVIPNLETQPEVDPQSRELMRQMKMLGTCLVPLFIGGRLAGAITTSASQPVEFRSEDISVLRGIGDLVTVTLEKLLLSDETRRRADQLAAATEIGRAATASFDLASVLETTVNLIRDRFGFYHASIFVIPPGSGTAELRESTGEAGRQLKARKHKLAVGSRSLVGAATASRKPVVVQDVRVDATYFPNPLLPDTRAEAVIPLIAGDTVVGAMDVQSTTRGAFSAGDIAVLNTIAGQLAVAVQNARLYEQTARTAAREQLASAITNKIRAASAGDVDGMLRTAVTELRQALGTSHGVVQLRTAATVEEATPFLEVPYCEKTAKCPFFNELMANFPDNARAMKNTYCRGNKAKCARLLVSKSLGGDRVPLDLYPDQWDRAQEIIRSSQQEAGTQT
jgi:GAF domain-containing protein